MDPHRVLVTYRLTAGAQKRLEALGYELDLAPPGLSRADLLSRVRGVHALMCIPADRIDTELLDTAGNNLRVVSTNTAGYDHIDLAAARRRGIMVGHTPDAATDAVADLAIALIIMVLRRVPAAVAMARTGQWSPEHTMLLGHQLRDKTVGIVGLGRIGTAVMRRLTGFGVCQLLYSDRHARPEIAMQVGARFVDFGTLIGKSDIICICCTLNDSTRHLFTYDVFRQMKSSAVVINVARGDIIRQDDLVRALTNRAIAGAGLDVMTPEPLPVDHDLFGFPNCVVLPHVAYATLEAREAMCQRCIDNVVAGLNGQPLPYSVPY
ncbi:hypothetical protein IWQ60_002584 [Tieghemiomyces parasiticus]|uniref:Glyoxylate reductase n=1 Tax=Tieghemiomyces parasiticus TaxID=78921 RepID=A0A9W8DVJ4_9FUNG|nr:hypothetical protein IWQ60_002584 [Tieghemiomyces parasiticus]